MDMLFPIIFVAVLIGIQYYFQSRRSLTASKTEKVLATVWLWIRRLVCFLAAFLCLCGSLYAFYCVWTGAFFAMTIVGMAAGVAFGYIFLHYGMYGSGFSRFNFSEDKPVHEQRKKRYGWRL